MICEKCRKKTDLICIENDKAVCIECGEMPVPNIINEAISYQKVWKRYRYVNHEKEYDVDITNLIFIIEED